MSKKKNAKQAKPAPVSKPLAAAAPSRTEAAVFSDLEKLCATPGFIHVVAYFCFRDNTVGFGEQLTASDLMPRYSSERLIRSEISTLMGLMVKSPLDFTIPSSQEMQELIDRTESLLEELHQSMMAPWTLSILKAAAGEIEDPFSAGGALREPIFYGAESAYSFQYRDLAPRKYAADANWLAKNKGVDIGAVSAVLKAVATFLDAKHLQRPQELIGSDPDQWSVLPAFAVRASDIASSAGASVDAVEAILAAFAFSDVGGNQTFTSMSDFNAINGYPILAAQDGSYLVLQYQALAEALYETPFFWMAADKAYAPTALKNRGEFAESFAEDRLKHVFGQGSVFRGVNLVEKKGKVAGEIDTLVLFGDRALVFQAKAKRLTIEARKGNDLQLHDDFKKAVQDAADQASLCAKLLLGNDHKLVAQDGTEVSLSSPLKRVLPVCIVADHYPALSFQARQFLKDHPTETIAPTLVTDVFGLDAMTEMLESPLRFLSYLELRAMFGAQLMASHELTLLSYHLKRNLWVDGQYDMMALDDDIAADLDVAMAVRRDGVPGARTPDGILTRFGGTHYERVMSAIESNPNPAALSLGLLLTELSERTITQINDGISRILEMTARDGSVHDFSCVFGTRKSGLTVHCTNADDITARARLEAHCVSRKYITRSASWVGVVLAPDAALRGILRVEHPWEFDEKMESATATMRKAAVAAGKKPGRNDRCTCGSGLKFKKCCLN